MNQGGIHMKWLLLIVLLFYALPSPSYSAEDQDSFTPSENSILFAKKGENGKYQLFIEGGVKAPPPRTELPSTDPMIQEFVGLVNAQRRLAGCGELTWDTKLAAIALGHSADMVSRHFFSHINPDEKNPSERLLESRLDYSSAAENLVRGAKTAQQAFEAWLGSSGHRKNMLDTRFTRHGVGRVGDKWTHILIRP